MKINKLDRLDRGVLHTRKMQEFNAKFSFSGFWLEDKYPKSYNEIEAFLRKTLSDVITEVIDKVEQECVQDYHKFVPEIRAETVNKNIEEIEKIGKNSKGTFPVGFWDEVRKLRVIK